MVILSCLGRAIVTVFLIMNLENLWLFPLAFLFLVLSKAYVSKRRWCPRW